MVAIQYCPTCEDEVPREEVGPLGLRHVECGSDLCLNADAFVQSEIGTVLGLSESDIEAV